MAAVLASFAKAAISKLSGEEKRVVWFYSSRCVQKVSITMSAEELKKKLEDIEQPTAKKMKVEPKCVMKFSKITENAFVPVRGSERAAGVDLCSAYDLIVPARGKAVVKTDLQVQTPEGSYARIAPRSGLAVKHFLDVGAGVIDEDYRGNVAVVMFNHSDENFEVMRGDRIAQLICERVFYPELVQVDSLDNTNRGVGGFGSTGVRHTKGNGAAKMEAEEVEDESDKEEGKEAGDKESTGKEDAKEENGDKKSEATNGKEAASTA